MTRLNFLCMVLVAGLVVSAGCGGPPPDNPNNANYQLKKCDLKIENFGSGYFNGMISDRELACPVRLNSPGQTIPYSAVAQFVAERMVFDAYTLVASNALGTNVGQTYTDEWQSEGGIDYMQANGSYPAGTAGYTHTPKQDKLINTYLYAPQGITQGQPPIQATATLFPTYTFTGNPVTFVSSSVTMPYVDFFVDANIHDPTLVPPLSYAWTRNGSPISEYSDAFWYPGADMGVDHNFAVTVTDANSNTVSGSFLVHTKNCTGPPDCIEQ